MLEKARVIKIDDDVVSLACSDGEGCSSCAAHGICGGVNDRTFEAVNSDRLELAPGDTVEVLLPTGKTIKAAFMVMIFPLLLFFVFFYGAGRLIESAGEGIQVLFGVAGIAAGIGINFLSNSKSRKKGMPEITRKLY